MRNVNLSMIEVGMGVDIVREIYEKMVRLPNVDGFDV